MVETALCRDEAEVKAFVKARYGCGGGGGEREGEGEGGAGQPRADGCNMFVVKDSSTNGAGGVWILSAKNKATYFDPELTPLQR